MSVLSSNDDPISLAGLASDMAAHLLADAYKQAGRKIPERLNSGPENSDAYLKALPRASGKICVKSGYDGFRASFISVTDTLVSEIAAELKDNENHAELAFHYQTDTRLNVWGDWGHFLWRIWSPKSHE